MQESDLAPSGGHFSVMTIHNPVRPLASDLNAPVLPADRERASELFKQVVGTESEAEFRSISTRHAEKNASRSHYRAFLDEIEAMFTEPPAPTPGPQALSVAEPEPAEEEQPEGVDQADGAEPGIADGEEEEAVSADDPCTEEATDPDASDEAEVSGALPVSDPAAVQAALLPITGGLISQLASTLADGGQLTFTMMRVGDDVTLSFSQKPGAVPLIVTATPAYLDEHLGPALQPYLQAQRDVYATCSAAAGQVRKDGQKEAAKSTSAANAKAPPRPAPKPAPVASPKAPPKGPKVKEHALTLTAADGSILGYSANGATYTLAPGANTVPEGVLTILAEHPEFGSHTKTLAVTGARSFDFRELQGGKVTFEVQPEGAALTLRNGEAVMAAHGEAFLAPGPWELTAEADGHAPHTRTVTVTAGKAQKVKVQLQQNVNSLF